MHSRHLFKILGLLMLAAVSVIAVSVSVAQAKWLLLRSGISVGELKLEGTVGPGFLLEEGGLEVNTECKGGAASAALNTTGESKKLILISTIYFTGCDVVGLPNCSVNSPGSPDGTIRISAVGEGVSDSKVLLSSEEFTTITYGNPLCPFDELEVTVDGSSTLTLVSPTELLKLHKVLYDEEVIKFGGNSVALHDGSSSTISGSAVEVAGNTWGVSLVGL